jgi:hypothetical protein
MRGADGSQDREEAARFGAPPAVGRGGMGGGGFGGGMAPGMNRNLFVGNVSNTTSLPAAFDLARQATSAIVSV